MNLYDLLSDSLLPQPSLVAQRHLTRFLEQYPYCTLAYALRVKQQMAADPTKVSPAALQAAAIYAPSRIALKQFITATHPTAKVSHSTRVASTHVPQHVLIDKFLSIPRYARSTTATDTPDGDLTAQHDTLHPRLYTPSLAQLLYAQGKFSVAIAVCEALKLKFPEKITYFDQLIGKCRQRL